MSFNGDHVQLCRFHRPHGLGTFLLAWVKSDKLDQSHEFKTTTGGTVRLSSVEVLSKPISVFAQPKAYGVFLTAHSTHEVWGENGGRNKVWTPERDLIMIYSGDPKMPYISTNHSDLIPLYNWMTQKEPNAQYEVREFPESYFQV